MADPSLTNNEDGTTVPPSFVTSYPQAILDKIATRNEENEAKLSLELATDNWLTSDLLQEVVQCHPTDEEVDKENDGARDMDAFKRKVGAVFVPGRVFASTYQVHQLLTEVGKGWGFLPRSSGKRLHCHYVGWIGGTDKRYTKNKSTDAQRNHECKSTDCPFVIRMSLVGLKKNEFRIIPLVNNA